MSTHAPHCGECLLPRRQHLLCRIRARELRPFPNPPFNCLLHVNGRAAINTAQRFAFHAEVSVKTAPV